MAETFPKAFGPYVLLARLGQGAAGSAYLARPFEGTRGVPPAVVVKCLHQRLHGNEEYVRRFKHEAELAVRVDDASVARVYDVGAVGDQLYIALEYVPGWTLGRVLGSMSTVNVKCPLPIARAIITSTLFGLGQLHDAKDAGGQALDIVHRDVSPKNVMVGDDGVVRIIDLGLGKSKAQDWKTAAGRVMGSPGYMPAEQISGESVDKRVDLYAVAVMLWELLTAERYIKPDASVNMIREALSKSFVPPSSKRSEVPAVVDELLKRAMSPKANKRFASADEMSQAISGAIPERAANDAVAKFVDGMLAEDRRARVVEVERLLALPFSEEEAEPELTRTEIWVRREGVSDLGERTRTTRRPPRASASVGDAILPTEIKTQPGQPMVARGLTPKAIDLAPVMNTAVTPTRSESPMPTPSGGPIIVQRPSKTPLVLAVLVALSVGVLFGALITRPSPEPPMAIDVPVLAPPPNKPEAPVAQPSENEPEAPVAEANTPEPSHEPPAAGDPPRNKIDKRRAPRDASDRAPPPPAAPAPPVDPRQEIMGLSKRIQDRAIVLKQQPGADAATLKACDKLLTRVSLARAAKDPAAALGQLRDLERELDTLGPH